MLTKLFAITVLLSIQWISVSLQNTKCPLRCIRLDNGGCQCYSANLVNYSELKGICARRNGKVTAIDNIKTFNVTGYMQTKYLAHGYWMAIKRIQYEHDYYYRDKQAGGAQSNETVPYDSVLWAKGEPRGGALCVNMGDAVGHKLQTDLCRENNFFICQTDGPQCPLWFTRITGKCVRIFQNKKVSHNTAQQICIQHNSELAAVRTTKELNEVSSLIRKTWDWNHLKEGRLANLSHPTDGYYYYPHLWAGLYRQTVNGQKVFKRTEDDRTVMLPHSIIHEQMESEIYPDEKCVKKLNGIIQSFCEFPSGLSVCDINLN